MLFDSSKHDGILARSKHLIDLGRTLGKGERRLSHVRNVSIVALARNNVLEIICGKQKYLAKGLGSDVSIAYPGNEQALLGKSIKGLQLPLDDGFATTIHSSFAAANGPEYLHLTAGNEKGALDALSGLEDVVVGRVDVEIVLGTLGQSIEQRVVGLAKEGDGRHEISAHKVGHPLLQRSRQLSQDLLLVGTPEQIPLIIVKAHDAIGQLRR